MTKSLTDADIKLKEEWIFGRCVRDRNGDMRSEEMKGDERREGTRREKQIKILEYEKC